jgi:radical SAM protein with 4Fe4S-binding SPASM domain
MKIEAKDLREKKRQHLPDIIPISTPYVVYIDPTNKCNFKCSFCPTSDAHLLKSVGRKLDQLTIEDFKKIIDDIRMFPDKIKLLSLYKDGEPMINPHFAEMAEIAKGAQVAERIWTKTNGSMLNPRINERIARCLDMIHISIEGVNGEAYERIAKVKLNYQKLLDNIHDLFQRRGDCKIYIKIADTRLSEEEVEKFYRDFEPISDFCSIEKLMGWSNSGLKDFTLGTNPETYDGLPLIDKIACAYPFYVLAVNSGGSVSVCGNDWSEKATVGNVFENSLMEIWNGDKLRELRLMHVRNQRHMNEACGKCYYLKIVPDNIDRYLSEIESKLINPITMTHK